MARPIHKTKRYLQQFQDYDNTVIIKGASCTTST